MLTALVTCAVIGLFAGTAAADHGTIVGRVVEAGSTPIAGAQVFLSPDPLTMPPECD
jgi:hypothetical protein